MNWPLVDAKSKLSRVLSQAHSQGPQIITKRGIPDAVVLSYEDFERLQPSKDFKEWLLSIPQSDDADSEDVFARNTGTARDVSL